MNEKLNIISQKNKTFPPNFLNFEERNLKN